MTAVHFRRSCCEEAASIGAERGGDHAGQQNVVSEFGNHFNNAVFSKNREFLPMKTVKTITILLLFLTAPLLLMAGENQPLYNLTVNIEPDAGSISVRGTVDVLPADPAASTFKFDLHETMAINRLLVNGKEASITYGPMQAQLPFPATRGVIVTLPAGTSKGPIHMEIEYDGRMKVLPEFGATEDMSHSLDDQVNARMVELAGYSSWYPQLSFGKRLHVELTVSLPQNWITVCSGKKLEERIENGRVVTRWSSPKDGDIVILGSRDYKKKSFEGAGFHIDVYYTQMPAQFIDSDGTQIVNSLKLYSDLLGNTTVPGGTVKHVFSPKRKGQGKAGFAQPGLIVTSQGLTLEGLAQDPKFSLFQGVAHEVAHYWWNFGYGQGDWINEAFAEYFSAVAMQKLSSDQEFRAIMADYRHQVSELPADAPPLATVPIWTDFVVRYYKGAVMLDTLRQTMGDEKFFQASREFFQTYTGKPTGTVEFRSFWKAKLGAQGSMIDAWMDSTGGVPKVTVHPPASKDRLTRKSGIAGPWPCGPCS